MVRFRIKAEHVEDVFAMLADVKIEPIHVHDRGDGGVALELGEISDEQGQAIAASTDRSNSNANGTIRPVGMTNDGGKPRPIRRAK